MSHKIDIDDYRDDRSIVLSGRPKGEWVRSEECLGNIDEGSENIIVIIPEDLKLVTTSFLLGLLGDSIRKLGKENFLNKFNFEGKDISEKLEMCIQEALKKYSPF